jgi:hypothetical protein
MAKWDWVTDFVAAAQAPQTEVVPRLEPLAHTRSDLIAQLANASAAPRTPLVEAYIAEANRRLRGLA